MRKYKFIFLSLLVFCLPSFNLTAQPDFRGINCGHPTDYTNLLGNRFVADRAYSATNGYGYVDIDSEIFGPDRVIFGDEDMDSLYFFQRQGDFTYRFDVPPGFYSVTLYFQEKYYHGIDFREFSILINGEIVQEDIDIYEAVGMQYAMPLRFLVDNHQQSISISFENELSIPNLSAVSVRHIIPDTIPPAQLNNFNVIGGYYMNILYWDYSTEPDLAGYRVFRRNVGDEWELITQVIDPLYRYFDYDVAPGYNYEYTVAAEDLWGNVSIYSDSLIVQTLSPAQSFHQVYEMEISEENIYQLNCNIFSEEYVTADLTLEGEFFPNSYVRYRGGSSRDDYKKNYKLKLQAGANFNNRDMFNLISDGWNPSMLPSKLGYQMYDVVGLLNPITQNIVLMLNDEYIGCYLDVEHLDNNFLERNGLSPSGNLYKCDDGLKILPSVNQYANYYFKRNNEQSDWSDIIEFIEWMNNADTEEFRAELGNKCNIDDIIDGYMVRIATADDDYGYHGYFMYDNPADSKWQFIWWDHNNTYSDTRAPINNMTSVNPYNYFGTPRWSNLYDKLLADSLFRYVYCKKLERFMYDGFTAQENIERIEAGHDEIYDDAIRDVYKKGRERPDDFIEGKDDLIEFSQERIPYILSSIDTFITDPELAPYFNMNELQINNVSTIVDNAGDYDPWLEIYNLFAVELDLEDFTLYYGSESWTFPEEAVVGANGFLIIWLDGEPEEGALHSSFRVSTEPGDLRLECRHGNTADYIVYPAMLPDVVFARNSDGYGDWVLNRVPTPGRTNTPATEPSALVINEFLTLNSNINCDEAGEFDDWIEIYNPTEFIILVGGLHLTDDLSRPTKWTLPDTSIQPYDHLLVWCDDQVLQGSMHAAFNLCGTGEEIGLYHQDGVIPIDTLHYGQQMQNISFGRLPDGADDWTLLLPTPNEPNQPPLSTRNYITGSPVTSQLKFKEFICPNPFNPATSIYLKVPNLMKVKVQIFDVNGRLVAKLIDGEVDRGLHILEFNAIKLASGIYFCRTEAPDYFNIEKMLFIK